MQYKICEPFYSFIHYGDLYSAPSRLLLRSAPDPCTAKKKSFETRVECVRKNPGKQSLRQRKPIPHRGTNHRECTGLHGLWMYEQKEQRVTPVRMIGVNCILWCPGWDGKDLGGRPDTPPDHGTNTEHDPLLEGQPVEYIKHVGRY